MYRDDKDTMIEGHSTGINWRLAFWVGAFIALSLFSLWALSQSHITISYDPDKVATLQAPVKGLGALPTDVCIHQGIPQIISVTDMSNGFTLVYVSQSGEVNVIRYNTFGGWHDKIASWQGATCAKQ